MEDHRWRLTVIVLKEEVGSHLFPLAKFQHNSKQMYYSKIINFDNKSYFFKASKGSLYEYIDCEESPSIRFEQLCSIVNNPYLLDARPKSYVEYISIITCCYAKLITWLCTHFYFGAYLLSFLRLPIFEDAGVANIAYRKILTGNDQSKLCLPRSIFIATTSKRFRNFGTMYIGCFFPSRNMHAWVIEDNMHADIYDKYWILYTPVTVMK